MSRKIPFRKGAFFAFFVAALAQGNSGQSLDPHSVNFFSGFPITSAQDTNGGFGDVAANINMAFEYRRRHPDRETRVIITHLTDHPVSQARSSAEIAEIMVPALKNLKVGESRVVDGVTFFRVDMPLSSIDTLAKHEALAYGLPRADVAIQLSAGRDKALALARATSDFTIVAHEPGKASDWVASRSPSWQAADGRITGGLAINTGLASMGFYLERAVLAPHAQAVARRRVNDWLRLQGLDGRAQRLAFAYSKHFVSSLAYLTAVNEMTSRDQRPTIVVTPSDPHKMAAGLTLAPALRWLPISKLPKEVLDAAIVASDLPPLVTGDNSLSTALASTAHRRAFVYEAPPWKKGTARLLNEKTAPLPLAILTDEFENQPAVAKAKLEAVLLSPAKPAEMAALLHAQSAAWDLLDNLDAVIRTTRLLQPFGSLPQVEKGHDSGAALIELNARALRESPSLEALIQERRHFLHDTSIQNPAARMAAGFMLARVDRLRDDDLLALNVIASELNSADFSFYTALVHRQTGLRDRLPALRPKGLIELIELALRSGEASRVVDVYLPQMKDRGSAHRYLLQALRAGAAGTFSYESLTTLDAPEFAEVAQAMCEQGEVATVVEALAEIAHTQPDDPRLFSTSPLKAILEKFDTLRSTTKSQWDAARLADFFASLGTVYSRLPYSHETEDILEALLRLEAQHRPGLFAFFVLQKFDAILGAQEERLSGDKIRFWAKKLAALVESKGLPRESQTEILPRLLSLAARDRESYEDLKPWILRSLRHDRSVSDNRSGIKAWHDMLQAYPEDRELLTRPYLDALAEGLGQRPYDGLYMWIYEAVEWLLKTEATNPEVIEMARVALQNPNSLLAHHLIETHRSLLARKQPSALAPLRSRLLEMALQSPRQAALLGWLSSASLTDSEVDQAVDLLKARASAGLSEKYDSDILRQLLLTHPKQPSLQDYLEMSLAQRPHERRFFDRLTRLILENPKAADALRPAALHSLREIFTSHARDFTPSQSAMILRLLSSCEDFYSEPRSGSSNGPEP